MELHTTFNLYLLIKNRRNAQRYIQECLVPIRLLYAFQFENGNVLMLQRLCMVLMALITLVVCRIVSRGGRRWLIIKNKNKKEERGPELLIVGPLHPA